MKINKYNLLFLQCKLNISKRKIQFLPNFSSLAHKSKLLYLVQENKFIRMDGLPNHCSGLDPSN